MGGWGVGLVGTTLVGSRALHLFLPHPCSTDSPWHTVGSGIVEFPGQALAVVLGGKRSLWGTVPSSVLGGQGQLRGCAGDQWQQKVLLSCAGSQDLVGSPGKLW